MSKQEEVFLKSEADQWFFRNKDVILNKTAESDKLLQTIKKADLKPRRVLEIGCSNGYRLNFLKEELGCDCFGTDPSSAAIEDGRSRYPEIKLKVGTADQLDFADEEFDLVIFGFLLYLCDRSRLFQIASESDRILKDGGNILIYDFYSPFPYKNEYAHQPGLFSYKMRNSSMFLWNPSYVLYFSQMFSADGSQWKNNIDDATALEIIRKNKQMGFPSNPYKG